MDGCPPPFVFSFSPEPPPPPWEFDDAFIYTDGPLTPQGGWSGTISHNILGNTVRGVAGSPRVNNHTVDGQDLGLGWFCTLLTQWATGTGSQSLSVLLFDAGNVNIALFQVAVTSVALSTEVDNTTDFLNATAAIPTLGTPINYTITVDSASNVTITQAGVPILTGVMPSAFTGIPTRVQIQMNVQSTSTRIFSLAIGRT